MYPVHPHQLISDEQFDELVEHGFLMLPEYIRGEELKTLQAAQRRCLKTWEEVKDNPPEKSVTFVPYPPPDPTMARLYPHPELLKLGRRYLKTDDIHYRTGYMFARYPGNDSNDAGHIDNGNNSLLPMTESAREYGQLVIWMHLDEVGKDQAPLLLVSDKDGRDLSKAKAFACPAGSIAIFTNYTWHAASKYVRPDGQRMTWAYGLGRADHYFEGLLHFTSLGLHNPVFNAVIRNCTAEERTLFRFPPPNNRYYTKQTLDALEKQYPGWNKRGEYKPMD